MIIDPLDRLIYLELVLGMWLHTRELVGKPSALEVAATFDLFPPMQRLRAIGCAALFDQIEGVPSEQVRRIREFDLANRRKWLH